jgi:4-amino-4-deoxy-L-arabinose transferase-like glycosyltransferase
MFPKIFHKLPAALVLIVFLCLLLQMLYAFLDRAPDSDEAAHMQVAKSIVATGLPYESLQERNLCLTHPPTICYLVAAFFLLFGEGLFAARMLSTIWSVIILIVVYRIGSESNHRRSALLATFILAINPAFLYYSHSAYMEITQVFFLLLSFYFLFRVEKQDRLKYYWLSGLFLGLSLITKYSSLVLFVYFIFWLLLLHRSAFFLRKETFAFILPVAACLAAWFAYGYVLDREEFLYRLLWWFQGLKENPYSWRGVSHLTYLKELIGVVTPGFLLIVLYSLFTWVRSIRKNFKPGLINFLPLYFFLYLVFIFSLPSQDIKYIVPLLPVLAIFISSQRMPDLKLRFSAKGIVVVLLLFVLLFSLSPLSIMWDPTTGKVHPNLWLFGLKRDYQYRTYRDMGLLLRAKLKPEETFLCMNKAAVIRYYAGTRYLNTWGIPSEEILELIPEASALVFEDNLPYLSNREIEELREAASGQFILVDTFLRRDGKRFWIYLRRSM